MRSLRSTLFILSCLAVVFSNCAPDAPHDNSLDPASPNHKTAWGLAGRVLSLSLPYSGVPAALVLVQQTNTAELTASDGSFSFPNVPAGNITLIISKASYLIDTLRLTIPVGGISDTSIQIDALPQISNVQVVTSKVDHWYPGPDYSALVSATVNDPDGIDDIDFNSVHVRVDSLSFAMNYSIMTRSWQVSIDATQLPNQDLQWLTGKQMNVYATDREGGVGTSVSFYVSREIEAEPVPTSPTGLDTTTSYPVLNWDPPKVSFDYTYQIQVFNIGGASPALVGSPISLSSDYVSLSYPDSLPNGTYYWTAAIIDGFGNSSRSTEASFVVREGK